MHSQAQTSASGDHSIVLLTVAGVIAVSALAFCDLTASRIGKNNSRTHSNGTQAGSIPLRGP
jgi:hypothetical protein